MSHNEDIDETQEVTLEEDREPGETDLDIIVTSKIRFTQFYTNADSFLGKRDMLKSKNEEIEPAIIAITETHHQKTHYS